MPATRTHATLAADPTCCCCLARHAREMHSRQLKQMCSMSMYQLQFAHLMARAGGSGEEKSCSQKRGNNSSRRLKIVCSGCRGVREGSEHVDCCGLYAKETERSLCKSSGFFVTDLTSKCCQVSAGCGF